MSVTFGSSSKFQVVVSISIIRCKMCLFSYISVCVCVCVSDPVESPVLSVVCNWSSNDSCNVTVTCRGRARSLTSTCDCSTCSPEEEHSTDSTLILSVRGGRIICNHSNQVSWRNATMKINQLCQLCSGKKEMNAPSVTCTLICPHTTLIHCITFMSMITYCVLHKGMYVFKENMVMVPLPLATCNSEYLKSC